MSALLQLIRQPIRTFAFLLLLIMASTFGCLGFGVLISAQETSESIESNFVTIALPTNETRTVEYDLGNGRIHYFEESVVT